MRILSYISFPLILVCLASPALAEQESPFKGGMKSIASEPENKPQQQESQEPKLVPTQSDGAIHRMVITEEPKEELKDDKEKEEVRIWNRYKSLAAGTEGEEAEKKEADSEEKDAAPADKEKKETAAIAEADTKAEPEKSTGFSNLLEKYEQNKARQSQMRTMEVTTDKESEKEDKEEKKEEPETP